MNNEPAFNELSLLRIWHVVECHKPGVVPLLPFSRSKWLDGVKSGVFPEPVRIGRTTCWKYSEIKKLILELGQTA